MYFKRSMVMQLTLRVGYIGIHVIVCEKTGVVFIP